MRLGYGSTVLPGIYQTVEDEDWNEVQNQIDIAAYQISLAAQFLLSTAPPKAPQSAPVPSNPPVISPTTPGVPLSQGPSSATPISPEKPDLPVWAIVLFVIVGLAVIGGLIYAVVRYRRKSSFMVVSE